MDPPPSAKILGRQKHVSIFETEDGLLLDDGTSSARVIPAAERADVQLSPAPSAKSVVDGSDLLVITMAVIALLRARGLFALHGACLVHKGAGWLLIGDSDTGKSTLAYTLLKAGWRYLTDDSMLLSVTAEEDVMAYALRRDFCMDADAASLFPDISSNWVVQPSDDEKRVISVDSIFRNRHVPSVVPRFLIFPTIVTGPHSTMKPITGNEAVLRLMQQSAFLGLNSAFLSEQMDALKTLARNTKAFVLDAAPDIKGNPEAAVRILWKGVNASSD